MKKICKTCNKEFDTLIIVNGRKKRPNRRQNCFDCVPFGTKMKSIYEPELYKYGSDKENKKGERRCKICKKFLPLNQFNRSGKGMKYIRWFCKKCASQRAVQKNRDNKKRLIESKGGKCQICGYNKCIAALDFHHINKTNKKYSIFEHPSNFKLMQEEAKKCILLCSNCHRELHAKENN